MTHRAIWVVLVGLAAAAPASAQNADGELRSESCPYLRLSLSTPQRVLKASDDEEVQRKYLGVFALHLERAGFDVIEPSPVRFAWELYSQIERLGNGQLAWSYALLPMPGLAAGVIEFPTFSVIDRIDGERVQFSTYHGLEVLRSSEFPLRAALASEKLANLFLPVALKLCSKRGSAIEVEEAQLKRIREELTAAIERVAARRAQQTQHLELKVEKVETGKREGPVE